MADPRWTDEAHALAVAIHDASCHDRTCPATVIAAVYGKAALAALEHLAPRLLPPGGQTRTEHGVHSRRHGYRAGSVRPYPTAAAARIAAARMGDRDAYAVHRTVVESSWLPAPPGGGPQLDGLIWKGDQEPGGTITR